MPMIDPRTRARARLALRQAVRDYLDDPNITLIELGFKERDGQLFEDELVIRFHVRQKLSEPALKKAAAAGRTRPIPRTIGGFQTDVPQGKYRPHRSWGRRRWQRQTNPRTVVADPLRGGLSISTERHHTYGTLGGLVNDRETGEPMILSASHVLAGDWRARPGQRIYQPGRLDGGRPANAIATLTRTAMTVNLDAAVATLTGPRRSLNDQLELGPIQGVGEATLGLDVVKSGRRSGVTHGRVVAVDGVAKMRYGYLERIIHRVVTIDPLWAFGEVSGPGDSGAIWLGQEDRRAVALHFAGGNRPERALALDIQAVLAALNVDLVTETAILTGPRDHPIE